MEQVVQERFRAVYLTAEDLRIAASILYNAYHDDPFFMDILGVENKVAYEQKLRAAIREELTELWQQEQTLVGWFDDERLIGVACVVSQPLPLGDAKNWHWRFKMLLGTGWQPTQRMLQKEAKIQEHLPGRACGILQFIALAPVEQRKGHGRKLLQAMQSWCDEQPDLDGLGVFVADASHKKLFLDCGFECLTRIDLGKVEGELWFYRRQSHG